MGKALSGISVKHIKGHVRVGGLLVPATMDLSDSGSYVIRTEANTMHVGNTKAEGHANE